MQERWQLQVLRTVGRAAGISEGHDLLTVLDAMLADPDATESLRPRLAAELRMLPRETRLRIGALLRTVGNAAP
jgi:hypothetical protein